MQHAEVLRLRQLQKQVEDETDAARLKYPADKSIETLPIVYGQNALMEEVGKLSRCFNKLVIAEHEQIVSQWNGEAIHRVITCLSLLERMYVVLRHPEALDLS